MDKSLSNGNTEKCLFLKVISSKTTYGLLLLPDSDSDSDSDPDSDSCTAQILLEKDPNLNLSQWKHVLHNTM